MVVYASDTHLCRSCKEILSFFVHFVWFCWFSCSIFLFSYPKERVFLSVGKKWAKLWLQMTGEIVEWSSSLQNFEFHSFIKAPLFSWQKRRKLTSITQRAKIRTSWRFLVILVLMIGEWEVISLSFPYFPCAHSKSGLYKYICVKWIKDSW